ncbi:MAG: hypothetical protein JWM21_1412 [Acidobacteria bacterium]|nr:hypothetical protein [Acidobacteriota bacterium]
MIRERVSLVIPLLIIDKLKFVGRTQKSGNESRFFVRFLEGSRGRSAAATAHGRDARATTMPRDTTLLHCALGGHHQNDRVAGWSDIKGADHYGLAFAHADIRSQPRVLVVDNRRRGTIRGDAVVSHDWYS